TRSIFYITFTAYWVLGLPSGYILALTLPQMVKLAETNQLVCHFRFDSHQTITQLTQDSRVDDLQQIHTGIMLSTRLLNDVNQPEEALRKKRA
ncbi:flagellar transcriptional regulator FlhD, partial [Escherichia coli]|uniref:flagellar transcriptional regulator FlhD n=1 Tax=Escherichia coli TaxID=562 RepID=UPI00208DD915